MKKSKPAKINLITKICQHCKKEFKTPGRLFCGEYTTQKKYCSSHCCEKFYYNKNKEEILKRNKKYHDSKKKAYRQGKLIPIDEDLFKTINFDSFYEKIKLSTLH